MIKVLILVLILIVLSLNLLRQNTDTCGLSVSFEPLAETKVQALIRLSRARDVRRVYLMYLDDFNDRYEQDSMDMVDVPVGCPNIFPFSGLTEMKKEIIEFILFGGELDVLEFKIKDTHMIVDKFVIVENEYTHKGDTKGCLLTKSKLYVDFAHKIDYKCISEKTTGLQDEITLTRSIIKNIVSKDVVMISHTDEFFEPRALNHIKNCQIINFTYIHNDGVFLYGNLYSQFKHNYVLDDGGFSYPYPVIWNSGHIPENINHKGQICHSNCVKYGNGVHLTNFPIMFSDVMKFLSCSECPQDASERLAHLLSKVEELGIDSYKGFLVKYSTNNISRPFSLPRNLIKHQKSFSQFFEIAR